jgi:ABC-type multidrug transport system fused ATPase/permease subunit
LNLKSYTSIVQKKKIEVTGNSSKKPFIPEVKIDNVTFFYPQNDSPAINDISLKILAGESVGIVGRTGSGKSTLIDVLLGVLEPGHGGVTISGLRPNEVFEAWEGRVGYVPQTIALIDGSIRSNILLGRDEKLFSEQDFDRALSFAGLNEHIKSLDFGIDTLITRAGSELSGGQRQKLGIARAIITNPSLLFLDEVTSSLDAESENLVNSAISNLRGKVTLIIVAHRLTTIKSMDRIIVLESGNLVAEGTYENLISSNPTFKSFVEYSEL